jgi:hypothetical protein
MIKKIFLAIIDKHIGFIPGLEIYEEKNEVIITYNDWQKHKFPLNEMGFPIEVRDMSLQEFVEWTIKLFKDLI